MSSLPQNGTEGLSDRRQWALEACTKLPAAELAYPFTMSTAVFKIAGKMFALVNLDDYPGRITLKCDPDFGGLLIHQYDDINHGYHMNKRHWITITLTSSVPTDLLEDLISDSYDLVVASLTNSARLSLETSDRQGAPIAPTSHNEP